MRHERDQHLNKSDKACQIAREIESLVGRQLASQDAARGADGERRVARQRWVANTSIVKVLSDSLHVSGSEVVDDLASRTRGLSIEDELQTAIATGLNLVGDKFESALIREVRKRLANSK